MTNLKLFLTVCLIGNLVKGCPQSSSICKICPCENLVSLKCLNTENKMDLKIELENDGLVYIDTESFERFDDSLREFYIELGDMFYNHNFKIVFTHKSLTKMTNLERLRLNNVEFQDNRMMNLTASINMQELVIQNSRLNKLDADFCAYKPHLYQIDLSGNDLVQLNAGFFDSCTSLAILDLSSNRLKSIAGVFNARSALYTLYLDNNRLESLGEFDLAQMVELDYLTLRKNRIHYVHPRAFDQLKRLTDLDLSKNELIDLPAVSPVYHNLEKLSILDNPQLISFPSSEQFDRLKELNAHYAYHCCQFLNRNRLDDEEDLKLNKIPSDDSIIFDDDQQVDLVVAGEPELEIEFTNPQPTELKVKCTPLPDAFTPCENLLERFWLRIAVWFVSSIGILSNISVVVYNIVFSLLYYYKNNDINVGTFLITNLATADSLMSIYLLFIAVKDLTSRNSFEQSALTWQRSFNCNLAGFLSVISSLASAFTLSFITFERFYAIKNCTDSNKRITIRSAIKAISVIWALSLIVACLPLFDVNRYSTYAICLPFDTSKLQDKVYIVVLNSLLVTCFFFICLCYVLIFVNTMILERRASVTSCANELQIKLRSAEDQRLAWNITLLVMVNIICWGPVVGLCGYSLFTMSRIDREHMKILAIFVIPFNSLINPFLYCISRRSFRMHVRSRFIRYKFKRNLAGSTASARTQKTNSI